MRWDQPQLCVLTICPVANAMLKKMRVSITNYVLIVVVLNQLISSYNQLIISRRAANVEARRPQLCVPYQAPACPIWNPCGMHDFEIESVCHTAVITPYSG
jgi:hypothetical protein